MRSFKILLLLSLMVNLTLPANSKAESVDDEALLFQFEFESVAGLSFTGNNPPINEALYKKLRKEAEEQAKANCKQLLGSYTLLAKTGEKPIGQSILHYSLSTTYLCGRSVESTLELVPHLVESLVGGDPDMSLTDIASEQLVRIGRNAVIPVIDVISSPHTDEEAKIAAIRTLGSMCKNFKTGGLQDEILTVLADKMNYNNDMLGYEAQRVYSQAYQAAFFAKSHRNIFTDLGYARALSAISETEKVGSFYAVELAEVLPLLGKDINSLVQYYAVEALRQRGLTQTEYESLLPTLAQLADPKVQNHNSMIFYVLSQANLVLSDTVAQILVKAVDVSLLKEEKAGHPFLFQAMVAMRRTIEFPSTKTAIPALREIAASTINPQNDYLQRMAKELLAKLGA